ncbi:hypothetical protein LCGC14_1954350 [marine sediment metagenome]|uniref:Uncharacterized protein n=1 Tax=marine sediment metagenome TaxID=412755 RepID=A0A0F9FGG4_9ZZZZ
MTDKETKAPVQIRVCPWCDDEFESDDETLNNCCSEECDMYYEEDKKC